MPVNVDVGNSIINTFLAGHQMAFETQKHQEELAKEKFSQELQTKKYQEDIRQFNEQAKRVQEQFTAEQTIRESQNKLAELSARQNIVENYQKGIGVPGLTENQYNPTDISQNIQTGAGPSIPIQGGTLPRVFGSDIITNPNTVTISHPTLGTFNIPTREAAATTQAGIQDILLGPQKKMKIEEEVAKQVAEGKRLDTLKQIELKAQAERDQRLHNLRMLEIQEKARLTKKPTDPLDMPIPPNIQLEYFGKYDPNMTRKSGFGGAKAMTPTQQKELADLDSISSAASNLIRSLDSKEAVIPSDLVKIKKNQDYFNKTGGFLESLGKGYQDIQNKIRGGEIDPGASDMAAAVANLNQAIALANFGKVIPSGEQSILKTMSIDPSHRQTLESVLSKARAILERNHRTEANVLNYA